MAVVASMPLITGLSAGLFHAGFGGEAGVGWGLLGSAIGTSVVLLAALPVVASGSIVAYLLFSVFANVMPTLGAVIALELRDTSLRHRRGVVVAQF